jgi:hypothetical protein
MGISETYYFEKKGAINTEKTLELARKRADELGIKKVVVASNTGKTGLMAAEVFKGLRVIVVTHSTGFGRDNEQEMKDDVRKRLEGMGVCVYTGTHAFGGIGRAVRKKLNTYQVDEIIAYALRIVCEGFKVACEISVMAADAGLVRTDEEIISIAGSGRGADTAVVLRPAHVQTFFDMEILEIICKPRSRTK